MRQNKRITCDSSSIDDQLFGTFARCRDLLRQDPVQAADRADLRDKLRVAGGGVVFTTIQKFMPAETGDRNAVLSDRRNIVVIADEAHRSQYDFIDGFARHMRDALPQASFGRTRTRREHARGLRRRELVATVKANGALGRGVEPEMRRDTNAGRGAQGNDAQRHPSRRRRILAYVCRGLGDLAQRSSEGPAGAVRTNLAEMAGNPAERDAPPEV